MMLNAIGPERRMASPRVSVFSNAASDIFLNIKNLEREESFFKYSGLMKLLCLEITDVGLSHDILKGLHHLVCQLFIVF